MDLACFCRDKDYKSAPVQQFLLSRYGKDLDLHPAEIQRVFSAFQFALSRRGKPGGSYLKKLSKPYDAIEVRVKFSKDLIRIPYYTDILNERIVLLNGFHKREGYQAGGKIDREVKRKLDEAQINYEEYQKDNRKFYIDKRINVK